MPEPTTPAGHPLVPDTASWLQRIAALLIDWLSGYAVAYFILRDVQHPAFSALVSVIFWLQSAVGIALTGGSFGHTLVRLRVNHLDGRPLTLLQALWRQLLVLLLIPPLVFRSDGRGLHDIWTRAAVFPKS